jgi:hypothetical protein
MRYSRLIAFLFVIASFGWLVAFGQAPGATSQATVVTQNLSPAQPLTAQTQQQNPSPDLRPPADPDFGEAWRHLKIQVQQGRQLKPRPFRPPGPEVDPGIRLSRGPGNACGAIVSYNFSPGENPELESVTTCTPSDGIRTLRTHDQDADKKSQPPLQQKTNFVAGPAR